MSKVGVPKIVPESGPHIGTVEVPAKLRRELHCFKCGNIWIPRSDSVLPKTCPECKNPKWHLPKIPGAGRPRKEEYIGSYQDYAAGKKK